MKKPLSCDAIEMSVVLPRSIWMQRVLGLILVTMLCFSCSGKDKPSPEFAAAKATLDQIIAETFDDSFSDPAFTKAKQAFARVPEDAHDYERAQWYVNKISKAQASRRPRPAIPNPVTRSPGPASAAPGTRSERSPDNIEKPAARAAPTEARSSGIATPQAQGTQGTKRANPEIPPSEKEELAPEENDSKPMSAQKKAYNKVLKDYDKTQKAREKRLNSVMDEIDKITDESRRGSR